tara:strand:+ start:1278 stop:1568 length:291 start_codon:yes stop_codon:yes gene_type:complete
MNRKEIIFRDPVVEKVVDSFVSRSDVGFKKYGVTLRDDPSKMFEWLNHLQEELMDAVLYLQKAKETYTDNYMDATKDKWEESHDGHMLDADEIWEK